MKHDSQPQAVAWFRDQYKSGRLELRPPFQRKPVWTDKQRSALIESALLDIPIPEIYIQAEYGEDGDQMFGVVDGQQRLRTILQFIGLESEDDQEDGDDNNNFSLDSLPASSPYKGISFADLSSDKRKNFFQYTLCVRFIYTENSTEIEDVFKRLNKFTMPLKAQELRNATYHGAFAKLSEELANDEYWAVSRLITAASIRRMGDIEMMSDLLVGLLHGPQGGAGKIIDSYYDQYEQYEDDFPDQNRVKRSFEKTKDLIESLFPAISECRWGNKADFYSLFVAVGSYWQSYSLPKNAEKPLRDALLAFGKRVDAKLEGTGREGDAGRYAAAVEKGSNDKARRADRHEVLKGILDKFFKKK